MTEASGKGILLKADSIANTFRDEIKAALSVRRRVPKLVGILATSAAPSKFYAEFTKKQCDALGVEFVLKRTGAAADPKAGEGEGVEEAIIEANEDESVDGIMVGAMPVYAMPKRVYQYLLCSRERCIIRYLVHSRFVRELMTTSHSMRLNDSLVGSLLAAGR